MAITLDFDVTIHAPAGQVFALATDVDRFGEWMQNFVRADKLTEGPMGAGTQWREVRKLFGREAAEVFEVTAWDPPHGFELYVDGAKGASKKGEFRFTHRFETVEGGAATRMLVHGEITGMGCAGALFGWMMKSMMRKMVQKDFDHLKAWIEGQAAAA